MRPLVGCRERNLEKQKELEDKKLKTENKSAVWSGNRVRDSGMYMDADGKPTAHCAEKSQEGSVWWLLDPTLPETGETEESPAWRVKGHLETTCKGIKTALAAIPPWSVITGAVGLRAAALLCFLGLFSPNNWMFAFTSQSLFRLGDWMMTREVKH